ncbi:MAG: calcium/sodium antiporter [Verrucomicrobiota bacterium]
MTKTVALIDMTGFPGLVLALIIVVGLCFLMVGGDWLCRGAASLAIRLEVPPVVVGLTVVSIATSTPELFTALVGVASDQPGLAIGNVIGSNAANMGLILGVAALITPVTVHSRLIRWEVPILLGVTALFGLLCYVATGIGRLDGSLLLILTFAYLVFIVLTSRNSRIGPEVEEELPSPLGNIFVCFLFLGGGTLLLWLGADLLVDASVEAATRMGVSETLIGITIIAIGTSLPELGATVAAAIRRQSGIIVGNIIGSNLFNILLICGVVGVALPFPVDSGLIQLEIPMVFAFTCVFAWFIFTERTVSRKEGGLLLALYAAFILVTSLSQTGSFSIGPPDNEASTEIVLTE